jgi:FAD/FMN-containing dehydrogenase
LSGSVIVDLKRMNRILEVDADRNVALVEPGVTYMDFYRYMKDRGLNAVRVDLENAVHAGQFFRRSNTAAPSRLT